MALASNVTLQIDASAVRFLPGAVEYAKAGALSGGLHNNRDFAASCVAMSDRIPPEIQSLLYDPQTSGGLLLSMTRPEAEKLIEDRPEVYIIGRVLNYETKPLEVRP
jgi:selenide,water dikinase